MGPPGAHGCGSSGSCPAEANGKGSDFFGGPRPRMEARFASRCASARSSAHGWPAFTYAHDSEDGIR
eukprot:282963-Alexandrium_andersonii.AAC.1